MTQTVYHQILRTSLLVTAFILLFDGGFIVPVSKHLSQNAVEYMANSVGIMAQIEPNELNVITAELTRREQELNARESALREIEARDFGNSETNDMSVYVLSLILFFLTVLILANYILDWRRSARLSV